MFKIEELTQFDAKELIIYYSIPGKVIWKERGIKWFKDGTNNTAIQNMRSWNSKNAGKEIKYTRPDGYVQSSILGVHVQLHRLIWLYMTGEWPEADVDHINGVRNDNRWENLRSVSRQENLKNLKRRSNNTTGVLGVSRNKNRAKFEVYIKALDKHLFVGYFDTLEDAASARKAANIKYGYSETHGREN